MSKEKSSKLTPEEFEEFVEAALKVNPSRMPPKPRAESTRVAHVGVPLEHDPDQ